MTDLIQWLKQQAARVEQCGCGRWRPAEWPDDKWTGAPPPPRYHCTPRTCPDCRKALFPTVTACQDCPAWKWIEGDIWRPDGRPTVELALASHGICPACMELQRAKGWD